MDVGLFVIVVFVISLFVMVVSVAGLAVIIVGVDIIHRVVLLIRLGDLIPEDISTINPNFIPLLLLKLLPPPFHIPLLTLRPIFLFRQHSRMMSFLQR
jgi:hypothetical protein